MRFSILTLAWLGHLPAPTWLERAAETQRRHLVTKKIDELSAQFSQENSLENPEETLQAVTDYIGLKKVLSEKLNRVL